MQPKSIGRSDFEAADHDLEDAAQIVTLADRARDPVQQVQAAQLQLQLRLRGLALLRDAFARVDQRIECNADIRDLARTRDLPRAHRESRSPWRARPPRSHRSVARCAAPHKPPRRWSRPTIKAMSNNVTSARERAGAIGRRGIDAPIRDPVRAAHRPECPEPIALVEARSRAMFLRSAPASLQLAGTSLTSLPIHCSRIDRVRDHDAGARDDSSDDVFAFEGAEGLQIAQLDRHADGADDAAVIAADGLHGCDAPRLADLADQRLGKPEPAFAYHRPMQFHVDDAQPLAAGRRLGAAQNPAFGVDDDDVAGARIQLAQSRQRGIAIRRVHRAHQRPLRDRFERGAEVAEEAFAARRGFIGDGAGLVSCMSDVAARGIEEQECDDAEEGQGNDGSEPRELEEYGTAGRRTSRAALRRCLCHAAIVSG